MWSEIAFQNLKDSGRQLLMGSRYSINEIEYALLEELKSD